MIWIVRILLVLFGLGFTVMGLRAMLDPGAMMAQFTLSANTEMGVSSIRADLGAFFIVSGVSALIGLVPGQHRWLLTSLALFAIAFLGRAIGLASGGLTPKITEAMMIEAISIAILITGFIEMRNKAREKADSAGMVVD